MALPLDHLQTEVDAAYLYRCIAAEERDVHLRDIYLDLARLEDSHAESALDVLRSKGLEVEKPGPSLRARLLNRLGKWFGYSLVVGVVIDEPRSTPKPVPSPKGASSAESTRDIADAPTSAMAKSPGQRWHGGVGDNALRAAVMGANDGLVSNMSLVMGVVGAAVSNDTIVVAGMAGLVAGALSMAMGEWVSVQSSKELIDRQVALEKRETAASPELALEKLELIFGARGVPRQTAREMATELMQDPREAARVTVREKLGVDPDENKGKALEAAVVSFVLFALGAIIPVLSFFWMDGPMAAIVALGLSTLGLFLLGAAITLFTGRSIWWSGMRQVLIGLGAAGLTFFIGKLIGISVL